MKFMELIERIKIYLRNNKLNAFTYCVASIAIIVYAIGLKEQIESETLLRDILSMSANYVAICSCIIVLVQLVAFFSDSRHKESRCRKEAALKLADEYASTILRNITFIQNVVQCYYDKENPESLNDKLSELQIDKFIAKEMAKVKGLEKYTDIFRNGRYEIPCEIIENASISYQVGYNIIEEKTATEDESGGEQVEESEESLRKKANIKFKLIVSDTLNKLEYFSMAVNHNVAESEMLFPSLHQTYLNFVRFMYPYICMENMDEENYYTNIIELYRTWEEVKDTIEECREEGRKHAEKMIRDKKRKLRKPL